MSDFENRYETEPSLSLGLIAVTLAAEKRLHPKDIGVALVRHAFRDWSGIEWDDHCASPGIVTRGAYCDRFGEVFWIITDATAGRKTTVMLPSEATEHYNCPAHSDFWEEALAKGGYISPDHPEEDVCEDETGGERKRN